MVKIGDGSASTRKPAPKPAGPAAPKGGIGIPGFVGGGPPLPKPSAPVWQPPPNPGGAYPPGLLPAPTPPAAPPSDTTTTDTSGNTTTPTTVPPPPPPPPADWENFLGLFGFDQATKNELDKIWRQNYDTPQVTQLALAYIRGTDWYKGVYPGINEGRAKGLVQDERDYRSQLNQYDQLFQRYAGRNIGGSEFADYLRAGTSSTVVERRFQGAAYVKAYKPDLSYLSGAFTSEGQLSEPDLTAYGEQQAGLDSPLGVALQRRLTEANQRIMKIFQGTLATPAGLGLGGAGLKSAALDRSSGDVGF